jgi:phosphocarrier protein
MVTKEMIITNKSGLHARPASQFIKVASGFQSAITIEKNGKACNAKSIIGVLGMGISQDDRIVLMVEGSDEQEALNELTGLINANFGEA